MKPDFSNPLLEYVLYLADNSMILGQRLSEWCGHGPVLEQDIALTNMALDLIGEARHYYQYASELTLNKWSEDDFPFQRQERDFRHVLLVEQPNGHWGLTIMRQFLFDSFHMPYLQELQKSSDIRIAQIAAQSLKETTYHLRYSSEWVVRLSEGTEESFQKMQNALDDLYTYYGELFIPAPFESDMQARGICPDLNTIEHHSKSIFHQTISKTSLKMPANTFMQQGGKSGIHSENLGFILTEMQYMQKSYPGLEW